MRDRRSLAVMFGIPLILYPIMTIVTAGMGSARQKELTDRSARVAVANSQVAPHLIWEIQKPDSGVELVPTPDPQIALQENAVDAVIHLPNGLEADAISGIVTD